METMEDQKIIREGEARRFEPKKVKLIKSFAGLPIGEYAIDEYNEYYIHIKSSNASIHKDVVQLVKDHFEPIEEPKREGRVEKASDYYFNLKDCNSEQEAKIKFREAIEKHMPQQEKITVDEIEAYFRWNTIKQLQISVVKDFLKSKGLLSN